MTGHPDSSADYNFGPNRCVDSPSPRRGHYRGLSLTETTEREPRSTVTTTIVAPMRLARTTKPTKSIARNANTNMIPIASMQSVSDL